MVGCPRGGPYPVRQGDVDEGMRADFDGQRNSAARSGVREDSTCRNNALTPGKPGGGPARHDEPVFVAEPAGACRLKSPGVLLPPPPSLVPPGALGDILLHPVPPPPAGLGAPKPRRRALDETDRRHRLRASPALAAARGLSGARPSHPVRSRRPFRRPRAHGRRLRSAAGFTASTSASPSSTSAPRRGLPPCSPSSASATAPAEMSFSAQIPAAGIEWSSAGLGRHVRAARAICVRPGVLEHARRGAALQSPRRRPGASSAHDVAHDDSVGDFLTAHRFSKGFRDWYLPPLLGCIWSCPGDQMRACRWHAMARFAATTDSACTAPAARWLHSRRRRRLRHVACWPRSPTPAWRRRCAGASGACPAGGADVTTDRGSERFDAVVIACHSDRRRSRTPRRPERRRARGARRLRYQRNQRHPPHRRSASCALHRARRRRRRGTASERLAAARRGRRRHSQSASMSSSTGRAAPPVHDAGDRLAQPGPEEPARGVGARRVPLTPTRSTTGARSPPRRA